MERFLEELNQIEKDTESGCHELTQKGIYALKEFVKRGKTAKEKLDRLNQGIKLLLELRPTMSMIRGALLDLYKEVAPEIDREELELVVQKLELYYERLVHSKEYIALGFKHYIGDKSINKVVTISWSSTVYAVLKEVKPNIVVVGESRPNMEGRRTALSLAEEGIKVRFFVDSALPNQIKDADFAIIGADALYPNGDVVNKIGSLLLAISTKLYNKPFYVIAHSLKLTTFDFKEDRDEFIEFHDPKEVWTIENENINVYNPYFELIPATLITLYFTEKGGVPKEVLYKIFQERESYLNRLSFKKGW